jgi:protein-L-isoaspartate(D-aspartate) O-methyltransferase
VIAIGNLLDIKADDSVLEIGTGLGYQAAILAQLARTVYSVEIIEELGQKAKQRLRQQGCSRSTSAPTVASMLKPLIEMQRAAP